MNMANIKLFALGGLGENGKNMYCVEVDENLFVFDAGLKYPYEELLGIDRIIPNFEYIVENQDKLKGIFLTHGHLDNLGAIPEILTKIPNLKIFAGKLTIEILKENLKNYDTSKCELNSIEAHKVIKFEKGISIFPVQMTHSIPDTLAYTVNTPDGAIFYSGDYIFDHTSKDYYKTDIGKLAYIGKQGVLALLTESVGATRIGHTSPTHRISDLIGEIFDRSENRIIITTFSTNFYRIQEILDEAVLSNRRVIPFGKKLEIIFNKAVELGYLRFPEDMVGSFHDIGKNDDDCVILVSGQRDRPFSGIYKVLRGHDKFLKVRHTDSIIIASPAINGTEKISAKINDLIHKSGAKDITIIKRREYQSLHAAQEDLLMLNSLMDPDYYIPVKGEYRHQVANANVVTKAGFDEKNVLLIDNGEVLNFVDGKLQKTRSKIKTGDVLIDGLNVGDLGNAVLKDRELLKKDGIVVVNCTLDRRSKNILAGPEVVTRGFVYVKESKELIEEIKTLSVKIIKRNIVGNRIDFTAIKQEIREELTQNLYKKTNRRPIVITMIQTV
jgi:ribonuclease J